MSYSLPMLVWLRTFEAAARRSSFAKAARELALTPAAVGQHMRLLEAEVGFSLFERRARGVTLTTMGRAYYPLVRKGLDDLSVATVSLFGSRGRSSLTIRCAVSFATLCLAPLLPDFRARYPQIAVKIFASIWGDDLVDDLVDLEIRYGDGRWEGFDVTALFERESVPVCPPQTRFGATPSDDLRRMASSDAIHVVGLKDMWAELALELGWPPDTVKGGISVDTSAVALELVAANAGSALISRDLARLHHARGLVTIAPGIVVRSREGHFLLAPRRGRRLSDEAAAFRDWLTSKFERG